jgi:transposase
VNHLGMDVHSANFVVAHVNDRGRLCQMYTRKTSGAEMIDIVRPIAGPKTLIVEECHLAQWVKGILEPYVDELVICDPVRNKWIAADKYADDKSSARKLAELHRGGFIKAIAHPDDNLANRRSTFMSYYQLVHDTARCKVRLKAVFRQVAIQIKSVDTIEAEERAAWLLELDRFPSLRLRAETYFDLMDVLVEKKQLMFDSLKTLIRGDESYRILQTAPGIGPVIAAGYMSLIESPHRFSRKNKLWSYAGLGIRQHVSDGQTYVDKASRSGCKPLKWLVMQQFNAAMKRKDANRFKQQRARLIGQGTAWKAARRHVCRTMLSTVRSMWVKGEAYREDI